MCSSYKEQNQCKPLKILFCSKTAQKSFFFDFWSLFCCKVAENLVLTRKIIGRQR